jgi:hypothetical protein
LGCGSKAAGSQPREKTPGCCSLNCLEQPQKTALKKNARRWLERAVATRNKKRQKNALWLNYFFVLLMSLCRCLSSLPGCCGLNCLVQPQKATLKKNARWLKRAVSTRNKNAKKTPCG